MYLCVMCGLRYIIKLFWGKADLEMCNCGAAPLIYMYPIAKRRFHFLMEIFGDFVMVEAETT